MSTAREAIASAHRLVVKVGSSSLTTAAGGLDPDRLDALVDALAERRKSGTQVVLVSSGAIAAGLAPLKLSRRPRDLPTQQAAASGGQQLLSAHYARSFARHGLTVGQVLLTSDDVVRRSHYRNAQNTFDKLLAFGAVPVVNENDTVATAEIKFGDNDRLAALVAHVIRADALVLLSDVDALYTSAPGTPGSQPVREVAGPADLVAYETSTLGSEIGTGGMQSKLAAAMTATNAGIPCLLTSAAQARDALRRNGTDIGTAFATSGRRSGTRLLWLKYAATAEGVLQLDAGAVAAVAQRRKSLLPAGIVSVSGTFESGDVVNLVGPDGAVVARGFVSYDAAELPALIGHRLADLDADHRRPVVHADDVVTLIDNPQRNSEGGNS